MIRVGLEPRRALRGRHYSASMRQRAVHVNGIEFSYLESGPPHGPLALCLHGFPDTAHTWRHLMPALAEAGYHAVAPWMRGIRPHGGYPGTGSTRWAPWPRTRPALHDALGGDEPGRAGGPRLGRLRQLRGSVAASGALAAHRHHGRPSPGRLGAVVLHLPADETQLLHLPLPDAPRRDGGERRGHEFLDHLWADWSPGYDAVVGHGQGEGVSAGPGQPLRRHRLLPRPVRPGAAQSPPTRRRRRPARQLPRSPPCTCTVPTTDAMGLDAIGDVRSVLSDGSEEVIVEHRPDTSFTSNSPTSSVPTSRAFSTPER